MKINVTANLNWWVARGKNGSVTIYKRKPTQGMWEWYNHIIVLGIRNGDVRDVYDVHDTISLEELTSFFPQVNNYFDFSKVKWEDDKPKQLKDILRK